MKLKLGLPAGLSTVGLPRWLPAGSALEMILRSKWLFSPFSRLLLPVGSVVCCSVLTSIGGAIVMFGSCVRTFDPVASLVAVCFLDSSPLLKSEVARLFTNGQTEHCPSLLAYDSRGRTE